MEYAGMRASHYRPLSEKDIDNIHTAALGILNDVGMSVHSEKCLQAYKNAGAIIDGDRVRIPEAIVENALKTAPSSVTLYGRAPEYDLHLEEDRVYLGTGGTVLQVLDLDGAYRKAVLADLEDICRLVEALAER